jgi:hypothetical protein
MKKDKVKIVEDTLDKVMLEEFENSKKIKELDKKLDNHIKGGKDE